ncbi:1-acyl-sn-glycerol-3-phosphate acyltransferase [Shimwellia pseudoproteus]|uniref:lysophospholipid acyltransferase family protein n=1 Tax=Shimwellia pseudoproteus TaxID=570012 RepID=UPI0018EAF812|nr:lysophospholipid acyltransferase family protein [Shimwellia pseudoproteus]MBJ3817108.1 1-acyl-sn-glycerol-3-phosphate acyltransferase [Shimwellia pseudoproteus]
MNNTVKPSLDSRLAAGFLIRLCRLLTGVRASWLSPLPEDNQLRIYYANHTSHLDGIVIWASMPPQLRPRVRPVAAADYWMKTPIRRYVAQRIFNTVLIKRNADKEDNSQSGDALALMNNALSNAQSLIIFPEGTRGNGNDISPFKSGLWHLARMNPGVQLVPVYLENLNRVLPKGTYLVVPVLCTATFGEPVNPLQEGEDKTVFLQRARHALEELKS